MVLGTILDTGDLTRVASFRESSLLIILSLVPVNQVKILTFEVCCLFSGFVLFFSLRATPSSVLGVAPGNTWGTMWCQVMNLGLPDAKHLLQLFELAPSFTFEHLLLRGYSWISPGCT